ncbi:MAG: glycosyltransferase [Magnetococcus sp. THC-1_WYH]
MTFASPLRMVHTEASLGWGGQEIRILSESQEMIRRGHQVHLIAPHEARISAAAARYQVPLTCLPMGRKNGRGLLAIRSWLATHPVDVIITHSSTDSWLVGLACQTLLQSPPIVRLRHLSTPVATNLATRWLYTRASRHIVTTGEAIRERLIQVNGFPPQQITSIPTGIDLGRFTPGDRRSARTQVQLPDDDAPIIGIVATLRSWKGHSYLLEAVRELHDDPSLQAPRLVVVGDGPQEENLVRLAQELGLADRVHFAGYQTDPAPWLQAMDLFALPSYGHEGVPQALMQAMSCGVPVVSTPVGAIPEIITDQENGLLVPPKDHLALAGALKKVLQDRGLRETLGQRALVNARERFGIDHMAREMERLLTRVVRMGKGSGGPHRE